MDGKQLHKAGSKEVVARAMAKTKAKIQEEKATNPVAMAGRAVARAAATLSKRLRLRER